MDKKDTGKGEEAMAQFKMQYNKEAETYKLPSVAELDKEFYLIDRVGAEGYCTISIITYTRSHILRYINGWASYVNEYIMPNQQNIPAMESADHLDDDDRNKITKFMRWATYITRRANLIQLEGDGLAKNAELIRQMLHEWKEQKEIMSKIFKKDADAWKASLGK